MQRLPLLQVIGALLLQRTEAVSLHLNGAIAINREHKPDLFLGAIWRTRDDLSFDIGFRAAHAGSESIRELRLGLTWNISFTKGP